VIEPFVQTLQGAVVMAPMTKGSNLPYRRLCVELGARVLVSEMAVARRLKQRRQGELALLRRAPDEPCFGVQLAGNKSEELAWAAALAAARGADFVDLNLGCPIDHFTRMGLGAALGRQPGRVRRLVEAMRAAVRVPVTVKIRLGWNDATRNYLALAQAAVDGGAAAITVHGRTREARYRHPAEWDVIAEIAAAIGVPVIGNGDLLYAHEIHHRLATSGCAGVMIARGALIKPWIFREATAGHWDITAEERVAIYRRYVSLAREHWGQTRVNPGSDQGQTGVRHRFDPGLTEQHTPRASGSERAGGAERGSWGSASDAVGEPAGAKPLGSFLDAHGRQRLREFLRWHVGFWCRYAPQRPDGTWPSMQVREAAWPARSPLEALLARTDDAALDYVTDQLLDAGDFSNPPPVQGADVRETDLVEAG
jgi:tRNA-dihydrouridine synthase 3